MRATRLIVHRFARPSPLNAVSYRCYSRKAISLKLPDLEFSAKKSTPNFCDKCPPPDRDTPYTRLFPEEHEKDIDYKKAMPAAFHLRHLLVSTGEHIWPKAIEKDEGSLAHEIAEKRHEFPLRSKMAKAGLLISNTTLPCTGSKTVSSAYLFPDNLYIPAIPHNETDAFLEVMLEENDEIRAIKLKNEFDAVDNTSDLWLVCGHAERDARCGDIGPFILGEMNEIRDEKTTQTGLISHIGGHAFAGNVLLFSAKDGKSSWFGRVRPEHIQGLVKEWKDGRIVKELYRGSFAE